MADRRQIGVRYCGGCNPRYDRVALVKRIGGFFPEAEFVTAQAGVKYPAVLVVCGCPSRCANVSDLAVPAGRLIYLSGWEELLPVKEKLAEALKGQQARSLTGHFPGTPVLPGVYTIEAAAQAADILMMTTERYAGKLPLFMGVREATFRRKILPGDTLEIHVSLLEEKTERAIAACRGQVFVEGVLAADLELRLAFR